MLKLLKISKLITNLQNYKCNSVLEDKSNDNSTFKT